MTEDEERKKEKRRERRMVRKDFCIFTEKP